MKTKTGLIIAIPTLLAAANAYAEPTIKDAKYTDLGNEYVSVSATVKPSSPANPVDLITLVNAQNESEIIAKRPNSKFPLPKDGKLVIPKVSKKGRKGFTLIAHAKDGIDREIIPLTETPSSKPSAKPTPVKTPQVINVEPESNTNNAWKFSMEDELKGGWSYSQMKFESLPGRWPAGSTSTTSGFDGYARIRPSLANSSWGFLTDASFDLNKNTTEDDFGKSTVNGTVWDTMIGPQVRLSKEAVVYFLAGINGQNFKTDSATVDGKGLAGKLGLDLDKLKTRFEFEVRNRKGNAVSPLINYEVDESEYNFLAQTGILEWARGTFRLQNYDEKTGVNTTSYVLAFDKNILNDWVNVELGGVYTSGKDANLENKMNGPGFYVNIGSQNIFEHILHPKKKESKPNQNYKAQVKSPQKTAPKSGKQ